MAGQKQIIQNRETAEQFQVLKSSGYPHVGYLMGRGVGYIFFPKINIPYGGMVEPGNAVQDASLSRPIGTNYGGD